MKSFKPVDLFSSFTLYLLQYVHQVWCTLITGNNNLLSLLKLKFTVNSI